MRPPPCIDDLPSPPCADDPNLADAPAIDEARADASTPPLEGAGTAPAPVVLLACCLFRTNFRWRAVVPRNDAVRR